RSRSRRPECRARLRRAALLLQSGAAAAPPLRILPPLAAPRLRSPLPRRRRARGPRALRPRPARCRSLVHLVLEILMVEPVSELRALRREVPQVLGYGLDLDRELLDDGNSEAFDADDLLRIVGEDANRRESEHGQDLVADAVV